MHKPNKWIILKIKDNDTINLTYHILSGWSGGYLDGDSWRLSTNIKEIIEEEDKFIIKTESGSDYTCNKNSEGFTGLMSHVLEQQKKSTMYDVETIQINDFLQIFQDKEQ
jgi:hypothetical protein